MKKSLIVALLGISMAFISAPLLAVEMDNGDEPEMMSQQDRPYKAARQKLKRMSPEERRSFMADTKTKWDKLSDDEKNAFKEKVKPQAERFKERMEKRCKEMQENDGEKIYIRMYGMEQLKNNGGKR